MLVLKLHKGNRQHTECMHFAPSVLLCIYITVQKRDQADFNWFAIPWIPYPSHIHPGKAFSVILVFKWGGSLDLPRHEVHIFIKSTDWSFIPRSLSLLTTDYFIWVLNWISPHFVFGLHSCCQRTPPEVFFLAENLIRLLIWLIISNGALLKSLSWYARHFFLKI